MNVRDLLDIRAICQFGSLRKAAGALGVTQPALSKRIVRLEDQLGATLFERGRGQSRPTDLALFIASRAAMLTEEVARLTGETRRVASGDAGLVRLGLGPGPIRMLFADIVATISSRWPGISLELVSGSTAQLADGLLRRELDLLVCPPIDSPPAAIASEPLLESRIVVVARPDHPACTRPPAGIREMFAYPIATAFMEPRYLDILRNDYGIDLAAQSGRVVCSDFELLVRIVARSPRLFAAGPWFAFAAEIEAGRLRVVDLEVPFRHLIHLHANRLAYTLPAVTEIAGIVRSSFVEIRAAEAARTWHPDRSGRSRSRRSRLSRPAAGSTW